MIEWMDGWWSSVSLLVESTACKLQHHMRNQLFTYTMFRLDTHNFEQCLVAADAVHMCTTLVSQAMFNAAA